MDDASERGLARLMAEIGRTRMPFGKFGPDSFPPSGVPIYDLPYEYLAFFRKNGLPQGRLGELLEVVYWLKRDGADPPAFDPLRRAAGGRHSLRRGRRRHWQFPQDD